MPYIFGVLLALNVLLFGYFCFKPETEEGSVKKARAELQQPINAVSSSHEIPPEIGQK